MTVTVQLTPEQQRQLEFLRNWLPDREPDPEALLLAALDLAVRRISEIAGTPVWRQSRTDPDVNELRWERAKSLEKALASELLYGPKRKNS